jgi:amino acid adenylation domain-containing protein
MTSFKKGSHMKSPLGDVVDGSFMPDTLVDVLRHRAMHDVARLAYTYLVDGENVEASITYGELDRQARRIGAWLKECIASGERVLLLFMPGLEYIAAFFGCLYASMIAVPAFPPNHGRSRRGHSRLEAIVRDAQVALILTSASTESKVREFVAGEEVIGKIKWAAIEDIPQGIEERWRNPAISGDDVVFLQYTSGSTAHPKGVIISHSNLLSNERMIQVACNHTAESTFVGWLPFYHDMGLIGNVIQPLYLGARCILMSPAAFLQKPERWLKAISRYRARTSGGPNFAFDLCVRKIRLEERQHLDLSSWDVAFNGAEPAHAETIERFTQAFEPCGFRRQAFFPCYGLAEASLIVSGSKRSAPVVKKVDARALERNRIEEITCEGPGHRTLVGCGNAVLATRIVVVNPETLRRCAPNEVGEIWVSGPNVARGYWKQPEKTEQIFGANLSDTDEGPFLRTGDLGFLDRGELFVTGRLQDLIIIRGQNHYPEDIEWTILQSLPIPGMSAAFSVEVEAGERLIILQEVDRRANLPIELLARSIRQAVAQNHEIQVHTVGFVKQGGIPRTTSGKIQRHLCRKEYLAGTLDLIAIDALNGTTAEAPEIALSGEDLIAANATERATQLQSYLRNQLGHLLRLAEIPLDQPLIAMGIDSLLAFEVKMQVEADLGLDLPISCILAGATVGQLTTQLLDQLLEASPVRAVLSLRDQAEDYPLSYGQQALWFLHQLAPQRAAYNIARAIRIRGFLNREALRNAFRRVMDRHASLRTTFIMKHGEPVQRVKPAAGEMETIDATAWSESELMTCLHRWADRPFDLENGPLAMAKLFIQSPDAHVLLLTIHHIVSDLWSFGIILRDLRRFYSMEEISDLMTPSKLSPTYADYVHWQAELIASERGEQLWKYWQNQLGGELTLLDLPADAPRSPVPSFRGKEFRFRLGAQLSGQLRALARAQQATLYMVLLAGFQALLHRYTNQEWIQVGSPTVGRGSYLFSDVVGYFTNPVVLRTRFSDEMTFEQLLDQVRQIESNAVAYQDYPFPLLVERLQPLRDPGRTPLFQVMFALQGAPADSDYGSVLPLIAIEESGARMGMGNLSLETLPLEKQTTQFDLTLIMAEADLELLALFKYDVDLFKAARIERMATHFLLLLAAIAENPKERISALPLLSQSERRQVLVERSSGPRLCVERRCIHEYFEAQAEQIPETMAVICGEAQLSYGELNVRANQLAHHLRMIGAGRGVIVGICLDRSVEMIIAVLGVLKAGAAYLPLNPAYPQKYLELILRESGVGVVVTLQQIGRKLATSEARLVCMDLIPELAGDDSRWNLTNEVTPDDLAYVIFTSGTAGVPKGIMVPQGAVINLFAALNEAIYHQPCRQAWRVGLNAPIWFDASVKQTIMLLSGHLLDIIPEEARSVASATLKYLEEHALDVLDCTPSHLKMWIAAGVLNSRKPRTLLIGGEAIEEELWQTLRQSELIYAYNVYGPTECTVDTSVCMIRGHTRPTIGRPIANVEVYILDPHSQPTPVGVPSELHIGGVGLAWGYLGRPDLTADKFIPHPWSNESGARLYRSGDLARYSEDGTIEFLGRIDHEVKLRGFRIEPSMLENELRAHPSIREALVIARNNVDGNKELAAYVIPNDGTIDICDVQSFLKERLPDYMLPAGIATLEEFPLNANGKLHLNALPPIDAARPDSLGSFVEPRTLLEEVLSDIWAKVLNIERIGIFDNFFELGGQSLMATQIVAQLQDIFPTETPLLTLFFENPTVAGLATSIANNSVEGMDAEEIAHLRRRIEGLVDEEVDFLLTKEDDELSQMFNLRR